MEYEKLLEKAYEKVKVVSMGSERFSIPKVEGSVSGKNTVITNITQISSYLRRSTEHLIKFLLKELAVSGKLTGERLNLNGRISSAKVNEKIHQYVKEFVLCPVCQKPDTEITTEKGLKSRHCLACGAKSPIKKF
jgi:translation initiation factor 2 subunit 2